MTSSHTLTDEGSTPLSGGFFGWSREIIIGFRSYLTSSPPLSFVFLPSPSPLLGVFVMCAAIIYTVMSPDDGSGAQFGYAYVLAWVAFPLCLVSGLIYIVLRKKE